jgi:hypothetical protein
LHMLLDISVLKVCVPPTALGKALPTDEWHSVKGFGGLGKRDPVDKSSQGRLARQ